jgi:catechol 2,3-dioxygenase-like lactoylglutathione lyase family enzyme
MSLPVRDIRVSRQFYQKLGFEVFDDHEEEKWIILRRGDTMIGLFQDMFERNILTFNPDDVRAVQWQLKENGLELSAEADEATTGPAFLTLEDPDGNPIVFDQSDADYEPTSPE